MKNTIIAFISTIALSFYAYYIGYSRGYEHCKRDHNIAASNPQYGQFIYEGNPPYDYALFVSEGDTIQHILDYHHLGGLDISPR